MSCVLWLRGLYSVVEWVRWKVSEEGKLGSGETLFGGTPSRGYPTAMPGQESGSHWQHAWQHVAKARNVRLRHELDSEHFHVTPLLQSTTGVDMGRLCCVAKKKVDEKQQGTAPSEKGKGKMAGGVDKPAPETASTSMAPVQVQLGYVCLRNATVEALFAFSESGSMFEEQSC